MDENDKRKKDDFADHQAEVAGIENGRQERFLTGNNSRRARLAERDRQSALRTQLDLLLNDPAYRAAYERVSGLLDDAQAKLDDAMTSTSEAIERLSALSEDMEIRAAKLEDGMPVFLSADGMLYTAEGRRLGPKGDFDIDIPEGAPSWEQYSGVTDALDAAKDRMRRYGDVQDDVITPSRDRMNDRDNPPPTLDELEGLEGDIQRAMDQIEDAPAMSASFSAALEGTDTDADIDLIEGLSLAPVGKI